MDRIALQVGLALAFIGSALLAFWMVHSVDSFGLPWLLTVLAGLLLAAAVRALLLHQAAHTAGHFKSLLVFLVGFALLALIFAGLDELSDAVDLPNSGLEHPAERPAVAFSIEPFGHAGHSHGEENLSDRQLIFAVAINVLLTVAQIIGGIVSWSLALIADALHNFSDAASLGLAWFARKIGRRPADKLMTFGYAHGEVVAALINLTTVPIYDHLVTAKSYKYRFVQDDINSMAELVAIDLAMAYINESVAEIMKSSSNVDIAGDINREFQQSVRDTQNTLQDLRALAQGKYAEAMQNLERLTLAKEQLAASTNTVFGSSGIDGGRDD